MKRPDENLIRVALPPDHVYFQVAGLGNMNNSWAFKAFGDRMIEKGYRKVVIDLAQCRGLDSTFMGCILGLASTLREAAGYDQLYVLNPDAHCMGQMAGIGLDRIVKVKREQCELPRLEMHVLEVGPVSNADRIRLIKQAHEALIRLDKRNEAKFGPFLKALAKELPGKE